MRIFIKNARIIDPTQNLDKIGDILILRDTIEAINPHSIPDDVKIIDASGKFVFPGFVDIHVHTRQPGEEHKEDIESVSLASAAGGFTSIVAMANTIPPIDSSDRVGYIKEIAHNSPIKIYPVGCVTKERAGKELCEFGDMIQAGAVAFSDDGAPIVDGEIMRNALTYLSQFDVPILAHEEDTTLSFDAHVNEGRVSSITGMKGKPEQAEASMIERDIELLRLTGGKLHIQHISSIRGLEIVSYAKKAGLRISCEVTPHHLLLTEDAILENSFDTNFKMNPPLRSESTRKALVKALIDGTIDIIASDHAPHAPHDKDCEFDKAEFGVVGLETTAALIWSNFVEMGKISPQRFVELLSSNPAKMLGLQGGTLKTGMPADIVIFDPDIQWQINPAKFRSKGKNTPFAGWDVKGKVVITIADGRIIWREPGLNL